MTDDAMKNQGEVNILVGKDVVNLNLPCDSSSKTRDFAYLILNLDGLKYVTDVDLDSYNNKCFCKCNFTRSQTPEPVRRKKVCSVLYRQ